MKKLFFLLIILISLKGFGQVYQVMPQYGYQMQRADIQQVLRIPSDTTNNKTGIARIGTTLYTGNGTYWAAVTGGGGGGTDTSTTTGFGLIKTIASNVINLKVDTSVIATPYDLSSKWDKAGNTGVTSSDFLGTDYNSFKIKINTIQSGYIDSITRSVGLGFRALGGNERYNNTAIGYSAMQNVGDASDNTAVGAASMQNIRDGNGNTGIGYKSLSSLTDGENNAAFGDETLQSVTTSSNNAIFGNQAGRLITGTSNTGFGNSVANTLTTGINNAFFGNGTGQGVVSGNSNTILGTGINLFTEPTLVSSAINNRILIGDGDGKVKIWADSTGNVYLPKTTYRVNGLDKMMVMDTVNKMISYKDLPSGSGLTYPNTPNGYLNSYGAFPTLNTDSITQGTTNKFSQWVGSTDIGYSAGNVGIGTTSPLAGLHVNSAGSLIRGGSGNFTQVDIDVPGTTYGSGNGFSLIGLGTGYSGSGILSGGSAVLIANSGSNMSNGMAIGALNATGTLRMYTGGNNERMRIAANGDVSIAGLSSNGYVKTSGGTGLLSVSTTIPATDIANTVISNKSANYTITSSDNTINATTSAIVITLPTAVGINGQEFTIINSSSGNVTIATTSSQLIGNFTTSTTYTLASDKSITVKSDNSNYKIKISN